mmetsp:Transcript_17260/g.41565  ORF Transcript_17260/g.41565 Transcript_17260/m.41565 type:complete len:182 (-) Transcript_17260:43-588(-)
MPSILVILETGFEEIETVTPVDLLRRAGVEVTVASTTAEKAVTGRSGITVTADTDLATLGAAAQQMDSIFIPGGPAVKTLRENSQVLDLLKHYKSSGKLITAICAAPIVLKSAEVLEPKYTAHFSVKEELPAIDEGSAVVIDGNVITSRGAGTAVDFGLAIVERLVSKEAADGVAQAICKM